MLTPSRARGSANGTGLLMLALLMLSALYPGQSSAELIFTAPPRESQAEGERLYGPLADLLTRVLGEKVVYRHPRSWLHYQRDMRQDRFDIVFDGPHFISWRIRKYGHRPLARLPGKLGFYTLVESGNERINQISDLVNRTVCVIAPPNLSSLALLNEFRDPIRQPRLLTVKGGMKGVYRAFRDGKCDAMVLRDQFYNKKIGDEDKQKLRIVYRSKRFTSQGFTASSRIDDAGVARLKEALTQTQPELLPLLKRFAPKADRLLDAQRRDYLDDYRLLSGIIVGWEVN